jgi:hypothetical protein
MKRIVSVCLHERAIASVFESPDVFVDKQSPFQGSLLVFVLQ